MKPPQEERGTLIGGDEWRTAEVPIDEDDRVAECEEGRAIASWIALTERV